MLKAPILPSTATTNVAQSSKTANIMSCHKHMLYLEWTPGVSGNVLTVKVYTRHGSAGQWTQEMVWTLSSSDYTRTLTDIKHTATGTVVVPLKFLLDNLLGEDLYFDYVESDAGGVGKGTLVGTLISHGFGS